MVVYSSWSRAWLYLSLIARRFVRACLRQTLGHSIRMYPSGRSGSKVDGRASTLLLEMYRNLTTVFRPGTRHGRRCSRMFSHKPLGSTRISIPGIRVEPQICRDYFTWRWHSIKTSQGNCIYTYHCLRLSNVFGLGYFTETRTWPKDQACF